MKSSVRSRQEPRRVSNGVIIGAMLLSLCVLSFVKARYCATPLGALRCVACVTFPPPVRRSGDGGDCVAFADAAVVRAGKAEDQLEEQMNASIRMEPEESSPARTPGGLSFFCHALLLYPNQIDRIGSSSRVYNLSAIRSHDGQR
jgi:hypothetical protein